MTFELAPEAHDSLPDCDCRSCAITERNRLRAELAALRAQLAEANDTLRFVERWANHHGAKPTCSAEAALSCIQHYPPIVAITRSYTDGKVPDTPNPWAEVATLRELLRKARAPLSTLDPTQTTVAPTVSTMLEARDLVIEIDAALAKDGRL